MLWVKITGPLFRLLLTQRSLCSWKEIVEYRFVEVKQILFESMILVRKRSQERLSLE